MEKPLVIHVIDAIGLGGAEILYMDLLPQLAQKYRIVLVTLQGIHAFDEDVKRYTIAHHDLNFRGVKHVLPVVREMQQLIAKYQPTMIHAHLFWSIFVSRLSAPPNLPFYFSVHATMNDDPIAFYKKAWLRTLDRLTYRRKQVMIGVAQAVVDSFKVVHPRHGRVHLLHNFVRDEYFDMPYVNTYAPGQPLRLVAVNNLRLIKNIPYLVETLSTMPQNMFTLDVYGEGEQRGELEGMIAEKGLKNIRLMGRHSNIQELLPKYDLFVSPSKVEGFGIAVAEAMAIGLPVMVSSIPVYQEVCGDCALYFDKDQPDTLRKLLQQVVDGELDLSVLSKNNRAYTQKHFSKKMHLEKLLAIYNG